MYFDAGYGHRAAATAVLDALRAGGLDWKVSLTDLEKILAPVDIFRKIIGYGLKDIYNMMLRKGWTRGSSQLKRLMQWGIRLYHPAQVKLLAEYWGQTQPDMVVSFVPNFNRALCEGLRQACPNASFVTVLTDLADSPPHFWFEKQDQYWICGSSRARRQAIEQGLPASRIFETSGIPLNPGFYKQAAFDRGKERQRLGLQPQLLTGIVLFGGYGSRVMIDIAERLSKARLPVQLILICGHNDELLQRLRARTFDIPVFIEGFTNSITHYMHLSDFFIGKPGNLSICEALSMKLPLVVESCSYTMPQERYNPEWIIEKHLGIVLESYRDITSAVVELLIPENLARFQAGVATVNNNAVFEIPGVLASILETEPQKHAAASC